ncbi:hypothetical protein [Metabacillus malikii]|uniref:DUF2642 domain-containing protein n=1 Tax=Metabacillus malikii TaxID=1504265 RepID=A0ABT9ZDU4_9BACI|nr:hypothetical protein [Metabacillus malikii]MDQ0230440.1 hypothetical protein [Metabacillus malikii]
MNDIKDIRELEIQLPSNNDIHDEALIRAFEVSVGKKVFILTPSYPFVFIGRIIEVVGDNVVLDVNTTTIAELEERKWYIHIHQIEVFYIEQKGMPRIPELRDDLY